MKLVKRIHSSADSEPDLFGLFDVPQADADVQADVEAEVKIPAESGNTEEIPPVPAAAAEKVPATRAAELTRQEFRQLAMGFLWSLGMEAAAPQVPVCRKKYQVTAAGFRRREDRREVECTVIVMFYDHFDRCFAECADRDAQLAELHALRAEREQLEAEIRATEPHLASTDDLFAEFRTWDYAGSTNAAYRRLRRRMEKLQHALHQGGQLERIRRTGVADYCYLAVPAGLVAADEIAAGWGLVYLGPDRTFHLVREAELQPEVTAKGRFRLVQNIAIAAGESVRFASGVDCGSGGRISYRRLPRRRGFRR